MTDHQDRYGPHNPDDCDVAHDIAERVVDLSEVQMNYATAGAPTMADPHDRNAHEPSA
jgi:hypothetical protein